MRPRDLFGIAVRVLALWYWTQSVYWAWWALVKSINPRLGNLNIQVGEDVATAVLYALLGFVLFLAARQLTWIAYGDMPTADTND